jgi:hypothetical protein
MIRRPRNAETMKAGRATIAADLAKLDKGDGFMAAATMLCGATPDGEARSAGTRRLRPTCR